MKLRIKGDSLRIRVTQAELQDFVTQGQVEDRIRFGPNRALAYRLALDSKASALTAGFEQDSIEVRIPEADARKWSESNLVTLSGTQEQAGLELRIVVEKDFACLQPRDGEDESDNFPHPAEATASGPRC